MEHGIINGFSNRDKLIERLVDSYNNKTAPEIILLTGPAGSGKSFVANNVVKKCEKISRMRSSVCEYYTHLRAHETKANLVCRLLLEKKKLL